MRSFDRHALFSPQGPLGDERAKKPVTHLPRLPVDEVDTHGDDTWPAMTSSLQGWFERIQTEMREFRSKANAFLPTGPTREPAEAASMEAVSQS